VGCSFVLVKVSLRIDFFIEFEQILDKLEYFDLSLHLVVAFAH
jgi:hypothetical protein